MRCESCGAEAPTRFVRFFLAVGLVLVGYHRTAEGEFCRACIGRYFWRYTAVCLVFGWWGLLEVILNPFLILNNVVRYLGCLRLGRSAYPTDPHTLVLSAEAEARLRPHADRLLLRWRRGELTPETAAHYAELAGVTPAEVVRYVDQVLDDIRDGRR